MVHDMRPEESQLGGALAPARLRGILKTTTYLSSRLLDLSLPLQGNLRSLCQLRSRA